MQSSTTNKLELGGLFASAAIMAISYFYIFEFASINNYAETKAAMGVFLIGYITLFTLLFFIFLRSVGPRAAPVHTYTLRQEAGGSQGTI